MKHGPSQPVSWSEVVACLITPSDAFARLAGSTPATVLTFLLALRAARWLRATMSEAFRRVRMHRSSGIAGPSASDDVTPPPAPAAMCLAAARQTNTCGTSASSCRCAPRVPSTTAATRSETTIRRRLCLRRRLRSGNLVAFCDGIDDPMVQAPATNAGGSPRV